MNPTKIPTNRWTCPHCHAEGWVNQASRPMFNPRYDHDRPDGRKCRLAEQDGKQAAALEAKFEQEARTLQSFT